MQKKGKFFTRLWLLISIIIFVFGSALIGLFGYYQVKLQAQENAELEYITLNMYASKLDNEIRQMYEYIDFLMLEKRIKNYAYGDTSEYNKIKIREHLFNNYIFTNNTKFRIVLYKPEHDCFIGVDGIEHLAEVESKYGKIPYRKSEVEKINENLRISFFDKDETDDKWVVFFEKLTVDKTYDLCFLVVLDKEALTEELEQIQMDSLYISEGKKLLFRYNNESSEGNVIWTNSSEVLNWEYGLARSESNAPIYFFLLIIIFLIIWGVISVIGGKYIAIKTYAPFKTFLGKFFDDFDDEFDAIETMITGLENSNLHLKSKTEHYSEKMKQSFLKNVFLGTLSTDKIAAEKEELSITIDESLFKAAMIIVNCDFEKNMEIVLLLKNMAKQLSGELFEIGENKFLLLFNEGEKPEETEQILLKNAIIAEQQRDVKIRIIIYDRTFSSLTELRNFHMEIIETQDSYVFSQEKIILHSSLIKSNRVNKLCYPLETENKFIAFIRDGNWEEAYKLLQNILDVNMLENDVPSEDIVELKFALITTAKRVIDIFNLSEMKLTDGRGINEIVVFSHTYERLAEDLKQFYKNVFADINSIEQNEQSVLFNHINSYVAENFMNADKMSSVNIASHFNISVGYISKLYKKYNNETFIEHLIAMRIEEAKRLLKQSPPIKIKDVGERVGYLNTNSFIRTFKKMTGVTPESYRAQNN